MNIHGVELIEKDDMVCLSHRANGDFEPISVSEWMRHCDGTVIDVGAYTGLYTIIAAKAGAKVVAFEPNERVRERLVENMQANNVTGLILCAAAGAEHGTCSLNTKGRPRLTSAGTVVPGGDIDLVPIDSLDIDDVTAIKIDAEGYEHDVLMGAIEIIAMYRPLVIAEALSGEAAAQLDNFMLDFGYTVQEADERNRIYHADEAPAPMH